jgi:hypothetical protein
MASDIIAAVDETAANVLLAAAETAVATKSAAGSGSLGPFVAGWTASASFSGGTVGLAAPATVSINNLQINYSLSLTVGIDLSSLDFCLPQLCLSTPWGDLCTPRICFDFPTISVTVPFSSSATISADFGIDVHLTGGLWLVDIVIESIPTLDLGTAATLLLTAIGAAISLALLAVPFIGLVLSLAAAFITAAFGLAEVTGLLGPIVSLFVSGLTFTVAKPPQHFPVLPSGGPFDPPVFAFLASVAAEVQVTDKNELVLLVDI